ncbi:MAG: aminopeptidase P family protein [Oscillospiraceae bacterium]|nr:aminopeptidase P family protein [Oscillospiraceae bacterium]
MKNRLEALRQSLPKRTAAIVVNPTNRLYFTGFASSAGTLFVTRELAVFFTDSRYIEAAKTAVSVCEVQETRGSAIDAIAALFRKSHCRKCLCETSFLTLAIAALYDKKIKLDINSGKLDDTILALRRIKSDDEVRKIKQAQRIAELAFAHILDFLAIGKTEREIARELDFFMLSNGADAISFDTIAVAGANSSKPHGVPGGYAVRAGDFVTMDFGAVVDGYHSDMTRTVAVGGIGDVQNRIYGIVLEAQTEALRVIRAGISCKAADAAARDVIEAAGFGEQFRHGTGHGVGLDIHEGVSLGSNSKDTLKAGEIVTVEPGIYLENKYGVRIEDMVLVTEDGCENLTTAPKNLIVIA